MEKSLNDFINEHKVILFSKSKCPYCTNMKEYFKKKGISYQLVELDKPENQALQPVLIQRTKHETVPQIFVDGNFIGGTTEAHQFFEKSYP